MSAERALNLTFDFVRSAEHAIIRWHSEMIDGVYTDFVSPYVPNELATVVKALDALQVPQSFGGGEIAILKRHRLWDEQSNMPAPRAWRIVGATLYEALGAQGKALIEQVIGLARHSGRTVNYLLRFPPECVDLAALPWELIRSQNHFLLMTPGVDVSCERNILFGQAPPTALPAHERPHALVLLPHFAMDDAERAAQIAMFDMLKAQGALTYDIVSPVTPDALDAYFRTTVRKPHIVHYTGHGVYREQEGWLLLDGGSRGNPRRISAEQFSTLVGTIHLAVILACQSAMVAEGELLTGVAPALSYAAGAVVAMQLRVRSKAAREFVNILYDELLIKGRSLQASVVMARRSLFGTEEDRVSWFVPTLYLRVPPQFVRDLRNDGKDSSERRLVIKPLRAVTVAPTKAGALDLRLYEDLQTQRWFLIVYNTSQYEIESIGFTTRRMPPGVQLSPQQIRISRARVGEYSAPVQVNLTIGVVTAGTTIPIDMRYLVSETGVLERHSVTFTLQLADEG